MTYKCKRCSAVFSSKNRLYSYIRECYIKTIPSKNRLHSYIREYQTFSNSIAASHICSYKCTLKLVYTPLVLNEDESIALVATAATAIAIAIATNKTSTSLYAVKITAFASKSQIASKLAANPLVPAEIASSTSPCLKYRAISPASPKYRLMKSQSYLTIDDLYTRYASLKYASLSRSYLTM